MVCFLRPQCHHFCFNILLHLFLIVLKSVLQGYCRQTKQIDNHSLSTRYLCLGFLVLSRKLTLRKFGSVEHALCYSHLIFFINSNACCRFELQTVMFAWLLLSKQQHVFLACLFSCAGWLCGLIFEARLCVWASNITECQTLYSFALCSWLPAQLDLSALFWFFFYSVSNWGLSQLLV